MSDPSLAAVRADATDRSRIRSGWPLMAAVIIWAIGLPLLPQLGAPATGSTTAILLGFALLAVLLAGAALLRMPADPVTVPLVGLAAAVATLLALAPLDRPATVGGLVAFLIVSPWRYALPPLVVHFTLEVGWAHRRQRWAGWVLGWYAIQLGMFLAVAVGLAMGEVPLVTAVDHTFRATIMEPIGGAAAVACTLLAFTLPVRGPMLRRALGWTVAAVVIGLVPLVLANFLPALAQSLEGAVNPARLALLALPLCGLIAELSLPFRDGAARDLASYRLAAGLLDDSDMSSGLRQIAVTLHEVFTTRGVTVRLSEPEIIVAVGEIAPSTVDGPLVPEIETGEDEQALVAPIGRSGSPLGEVRLEGRFVGAFGPTEREWLTAFLNPIAAVLRARRREFTGIQRNDALARQLTQSLGVLAQAARELPPSPADDSMAVPPPVDAREVLAQLSDGVTGVARHGEGLASAASDARDRARAASDAIARALDALSALHADIGRLAKHGEDIATSNDTVSGVAFRTNLVANNATLEATRAGAAGRTFGVLAEEVRRLADTTAATSAAIGQRTAALADEVTGIGATLDATRQALAAAIREAEAGEAAAQRLNDAAAELEDTARSLRPAVAEANAVAQRRTARDQHLTVTMERFIVERAALGRALNEHRDAMDRLSKTLDQLVRSTAIR